MVRTWPGPRLAVGPRSSSQAGTRATGRLLPAAGLGARLPRRVPSAEWPTGPRASERASERARTTRAIPRKIATHPFFRVTFLRRLFALSRFGGQSGVQESKHKTKPEVGRWGAGGRAGARSSAPAPDPVPAPARVARLGGQLLY